MISSITLFEIINIAIPDLRIFLCIPASAVDAAAVNRNDIKTRGLSTFFFKHRPVISNGPRSIL